MGPSILPLFFKKFSNMSLFWNYLGPSPCFETQFFQNRVWGDQTKKKKKLGTQVHGAQVLFKTPL